MKIIVIGYGRVGRQFVSRLDTDVHELVVIDKESQILEKFERDSKVRTLSGNATDEDLLREAGAEEADVLLALTRDENTNLMVAQIAKVIFNVPKVLAIIYDPDREASFHELGIEGLPLTVAGAQILVGWLEGSAGTDQAIAQMMKPPASPGPSRVKVRPIEAHDGSFYVIIVGGGLVGFYLARDLLKGGHEVTIIESDPAVHELVAQQIDCPVIVGDGSAPATLERVGASRANILCSVTNHDQDNLIACQVAKFRFGVPKTVARVKNPKNETVMRRLGVDTTVSSTAIITNVIENELPTSNFRTLLDLHTCGVELVEYRLDSRSSVIGKRLKQIDWPKDCNLVTIVRRGEAILPRGDTTFEKEDTILAMLHRTKEAEFRKLLFPA